MTVKAISAKYYELLGKLYKNINNDNIKWTQALNADYFTAELNYRFKMRIYKAISNLATKYIFKMYDDGGIKVFEIASDKNGNDIIDIDGESVKVSDILEEIYEWARAFSLDIIEKVDKAKDILDDLERDNAKPKPLRPFHKRR